MASQQLTEYLNKLDIIDKDIREYKLKLRKLEDEKSKLRREIISLCEHSWVLDNFYDHHRSSFVCKICGTIS